MKGLSAIGWRYYDRHMMISACHLSPVDIGWVVDMATAEGETVTVVTHYSLHPGRNQRQDTVVHGVKAEALWRGCRVHCHGGAHRRRFPVGRRANLVVSIEPPRREFGEEAMIPRRPAPSAPTRSQRLTPGLGN